jgi:CRP-like cAMP-binding protein
MGGHHDGQIARVHQRKRVCATPYRAHFQFGHLADVVPARTAQAAAMAIKTMHRSDTKLTTLAALDLFAGCGRADLDRLARLTTLVDRDAGTVLCVEGTVGRQAFVIVEGEALVEIGGRTVAILGRGRLLGEVALLDRGPRTGTVTALTPMTLATMSGPEFAAIIEDIPPVRDAVLRTVSRRLRSADAMTG